MEPTILAFGAASQNPGALAHLVAAFGVLVVVAAGMGAVARRLGQPAVVGEITGGVVLGPAVLGQLPGDPTTMLFPPDVRAPLAALAQIGLVLYMFTVGYRLDLGELRRRPGPVAAVTLGTTLIPLVAGLVLGLALVGDEGRGAGFVLLVGVLLTVTAVPVLARIIEERGLGDTQIGTTALTAATTTDLLAWVLLPVAISLGGTASLHDVALTVAAAPMVAVLAASVGRRAMAAVLDRVPPGSPGAVAVVTGVLMACAFGTSLGGLHLVFGALVCGLMMPRGAGGRPLPRVIAPMDHVSAFLLPVFFVGTGLSVELDWTDPQMWALVTVVTAVASAAKVFGGWAGARVAGMRPRTAWTLGVLMNSRGLTELVAIEIGRQAGLLDGRLYAVFVVMALLTTAMTGLLLRPPDRVSCSSGDSLLTEQSAILSGGGRRRKDDHHRQRKRRRPDHLQGAAGALRGVRRLPPQ